MKPDLEALIKLAASGNSKTVEEVWISAVEQHADQPEEILSWIPLLEELVRLDRVDEAETLAWTAIEALQENVGAAGALKAAGPFLLLLNKSNSLKEQVTSLYQEAYGDRENLEELLDEAGIAGGRPPRRALRTLEVCLELEEGSYLAGRHENLVAKVDEIDTATWRIKVTKPDGGASYGPVQLADEYMIVPEDDFRVLRAFAPEKLKELLESDPVALVINLLRSHGDTLDSDQLSDILTESALASGEWSKWWSKARTALKRHTNVQITGRSPYKLIYKPEGISLEETAEGRFKKMRRPLDQLGVVENYIRDCKTAKLEPSQELLGRFHQAVEKIARRYVEVKRPDALTALLAARQIATFMEVDEEEADRPIVEYLANAADPISAIENVETEQFWPVACRCLRKAYPERFGEFYARLLPTAPVNVCDELARGLMESGFDKAQMDEIVQQIVKDPVRSVNALTWLWLGPKVDADLQIPPRSALFTRFLWVLGEIRRDDEIDREQRKKIQNRAREAFTASNYTIFEECLQETEAGVASTWRTQLGRLDNLGRAIPEELDKRIRALHPEMYQRPEISPWKREDVLFVTRAGRRKMEQDIDHLVNVKMKENARAIGEAASHGDLSENSEYKFALEERDLLRARLAQMQEQLSKAVVINAHEVPEDQVGFGTRIFLRGESSDNTFQMTFLGPWEADVDRRVYNYKSPVGQSLMGKTPGDKVELSVVEPSGEYLIEKVENALLD